LGSFHGCEPKLLLPPPLALSTSSNLTLEQAAKNSAVRPISETVAARRAIEIFMIFPFPTNEAIANIMPPRAQYWLFRPKDLD
jgi:hypothetical protein